MLSEVLEAFAIDPAIGPIALQTEVIGGVVHLRGRCRSHEEQRLMRQAASRLRGINAVWDLSERAGEARPRVVDIGCGMHKQNADAMGVDCVRLEGVNLLADLNAGLPFRDESIDVLFAVHVLEHLADACAMMNEVHRVLKPQGTFHLMVPDSRHVNAMADPTHLRYFNLQTIKYFCLAHPGLQAFRPLCVATDGASIFADLEPVKGGEQLAGPRDLALWF